MTTISIIIPTLNRADTLHNTLRSILELQDLNDVEVIVIDNGSTDHTRQIFNEFFSNEKIPSFYCYDPEPGLLTGRHRGAILAKGKILCFLDDDVELDQNWLRGVRDAFGYEEVQLATGPCIPKYQIAPPDWLKYFWVNAYHGSYCYWLSLIDLGKKKINIKPNYIFGLNFCIRKEALFSLGGFHPDCVPPILQMFQGDGETGLAIKAEARNYKSIYHPDIKLFHIVSEKRLTVTYFKKRAFFQGVCNSFTDLKAQYSHADKKKAWLPRIGHQLLRQLHTVFTFYRQKAETLQVRELKFHLDSEAVKGYMFHQQAYQNNPKVREWVHKSDYWDYKLPH